MISVPPISNADHKHILIIYILKFYLDPSKARDAFYTRDNEVKEIESLIPEIREKIVDTKDMKTETYKKLGDKRLMEEGIAASFGLGAAESINGGNFKITNKSLI